MTGFRTAIVLGYSTEEVAFSPNGFPMPCWSKMRTDFLPNWPTFKTLRSPAVDETKSKAFDEAVLQLDDIDTKRTEDISRLTSFWNTGNGSGAS